MLICTYICRDSCVIRINIWWSCQYRALYIYITQIAVCTFTETCCFVVFSIAVSQTDTLAELELLLSHMPRLMCIIIWIADLTYIEVHTIFAILYMHTMYILIAVFAYIETCIYILLIAVLPKSMLLYMSIPLLFFANCERLPVM
jgi:hypothetical protein